jgi:hypothetical protein
MEKIQSLVIVGVIVAGFAVGLGLFMAYPDMMLKGTSLDPDTEPGEFSGAYGGDVGAPAPTGSPQASAP